MYGYNDSLKDNLILTIISAAISVESALITILY